MRSSTQDATRRRIWDLMSAPATATERLAYSPREAAEALGVSYATVMRLLADGRLRRVGELRTVLIPRSSLEDFLR